MGLTTKKPHARDIGRALSDHLLEQKILTRLFCFIFPLFLGQAARSTARQEVQHSDKDNQRSSTGTTY